MEKSKYKYPKECFVDQKKTGTFYVNCFLVPANQPLNNSDTNLEPPLTIYREGLSRFVFNIINEDKSVTVGNVPVGDIADIVARTEAIMPLQVSAELDDQTAKATKSKAYTVKFSSGKLKGRTPAEMLMEDPKNEEVLRNQFDWLKQNLSRYPKNKEQMDAINDAVLLFRNGQLDGKAVSATKCYSIYDAPMKPSDGLHKPKENGNRFIYRIQISWNLGAKNPIQIEIVNFFAPVRKDETTGMINVLASQKEDEKKNVWNMSTRAWNNCLDKMTANMRRFENLYASLQLKDAEAEERKALEAYRNS